MVLDGKNVFAIRQKISVLAVKNAIILGATDRISVIQKPPQRVARCGGFVVGKGIRFF